MPPLIARKGRKRLPRVLLFNLDSGVRHRNDGEKNAENENQELVEA